MDLKTLKLPKLDTKGFAIDFVKNRMLRSMNEKLSSLNMDHVAIVAATGSPLAELIGEKELMDIKDAANKYRPVFDNITAEDIVKIIPDNMKKAIYSSKGGRKWEFDQANWLLEFLRS